MDMIHRMLSVLVSLGPKGNLVLQAHLASKVLQVLKGHRGRKVCKVRKVYPVHRAATS